MAGRTPKTISAAEAAALVRPGMCVDYGGSICQPEVFDTALAARAGALRDVRVRTCLSLKPLAFLEADPAGDSFEHFSWHFGGYDRRKHDEGRCHYIPLNLGEVPDYYRRFLPPTDIAVVKACPPGPDGRFSFGCTAVWLQALAQTARTVVVEVTRGMPTVAGEGNSVGADEVDYIIQGNDAPAAELPNPAPSEIDRAVAVRIAAEVEHGACLQIGIGGMPNAVCTLLKEAGVKDLGIHTEMLTDGLVELYKAGCVTGARKRLDPGKVVFTFALGSRALYEAIDQNHDMLCRSTDYTNLPHMIMQNDKVVSINSTTQIDLQGQAASESDGHRHISGTGGQLQFVRGAYASAGGKSFICLPSTWEKAGRRKSRIVLDLTPGNIVTTPRSDVMYLVTEYGMACLKGKSVCERARAIVDLAHPDFRDGLERQAREHGLLPRGRPGHRATAE
ncbi:MAG TPA: acetyl-CoA hydrolase/transferase C-terminal domain-containing protein [Caulobacteraceae bacterium]|nr:acetyl-CoA hydrolase/transferase C-terminal domain-containing protein [Caulobacteraceae bacterium]